jgi:alpha-galactosidase
LKIISSLPRRRVANRALAALTTVVVAGLAVLSLSSAAPETTSLATEIGSGPVMGYDSWYLNYCGTSENEVLAQAHALINTGLAAAGYRTVMVDDCWMATQRTPSGQLTWDAAKFPDGMPALAATIHSMGLRFGLYEDAGLRTCQQRPGDLGHYYTDAQTFKSWGVNLVKIDMCQFPAKSTYSEVAADFARFGKALTAAGIAYDEELPVKALIDYGDTSQEYLNALKSSSASAAMWRVAPDERTSARLSAIEEKRELPAHNKGLGAPLTDLVGSYANMVIRDFALDLPLASYARPGHWNDLDVLLAGNPNYDWTNAQAVSQMSIWAGLASPLIISTDVTTLSPALVADLKNPQMIAIDQSGEQAREITSQGPVIAAAKPDPLGGTALLLVNMSSKASTFNVPLTQLGFHTRSVRVTDIWSRATRRVTGKFRYVLPAESATLVQVR